MKRDLYLRSGFTIVELIIVVVVIAILAALVAIGYSSVKKNAVEVSMKSDLSNVESELGFEYKKAGSYPSTLAQINGGAGISASGQNQFDYKPTTYGYCITVVNTQTTKKYRIKSNKPSVIDEGACDVVVSTLAGTNLGYLDATGTAARFSNSYGLMVTSAGIVYVADGQNQRIRQVTSSGEVTTYAGSGTYGYVDGPKASAQFKYPYDAAMTGAGVMYVADNSTGTIRQISTAGIVSTLAGTGSSGFANGTGTGAAFSAPTGVALDADGIIYVADANNNRIRKVTPGGVVTTLAGSGTAGYLDGAGTVARFNSPRNIAIGPGGVVYVADMANNRIRKVTPGGVVSTLAGSGTAGYLDGSGTAAQFNNPYGIAVDSSGVVYVADTNNHRIRQITDDGTVTTLAGTGVSGNVDGSGASARFASPSDIAVDASGVLYVVENYRVRRIEQ